jgi:hypothetical protein
LPSVLTVFTTPHSRLPPLIWPWSPARQVGDPDPTLKHACSKVCGVTRILWVNIRASKACYRPENACDQSKCCNKAHHVSKKESHFLRPTRVDLADLHQRLVSFGAARLCGSASVDLLKHKCRDLWRAARLPSIALNVRLVSRQLGAKIQMLQSQSDHCASLC